MTPVQRLKGSQITASIVIFIAGVAMACARGPEPIEFRDALTGPISPTLAIPFDKYSLTPAGLLRVHSESGTENGIERPLIKTVSGDYLSKDFVFEVDVTIPKDHGDIAYVGFGAARQNATLDNEPTDAFLFRIHNLPRLSFYAIDLTVADPDGGVGYRGAYREFQRMEKYTPGRTMRFRIEHRDGSITLSVPALPDVRATFPLEKYPNLFDDSNAYLFLSNSSQGTTFANASLRFI
jgi:hypothetical protein